MKKVLILAFVFFAATGFANERYYDEEFQVAAGSSFSLEVHKGSITINTHSAPVIVVKARIYPDEGKDVELVDLTELETRSGDRHVSIEVDYHQEKASKNSFLGNSYTLPMIEWDITVPDDASLELSSHKSTFDINAPSGKVEIETHKGTGTIRGVRGEFELETHKGEFEIEIVKLSDLDLETHKGSIVATIQGATDFSLEGESHEGTLRFTGMDVPITKDHDETIVDFEAGSGRNSIEISTHKGEIELRFLN